MEAGTFYKIANKKTYQNGQTIFKERSSGNRVFVVLSGSVAISKTINGKTYILDTLKPGETFGLLNLLGAGERIVTTRSIGVTIVGILDHAFLDNEFAKLSPDFRTILVTLAQKLAKIMDRSRGFTSRKEERINKSLTLNFKDRQTFVKAYTENISNGGLFVKTAHPLEVGRQFPLKLQIPDIPAPLQTKCQVVWARKQVDATKDRPAGMGVKFLRMNKNGAKILKQYLEGA